MEEIKAYIKERMDYCNAIAKDVIQHKACEGVLKHAKKFATIESPVTGEIDAAWVRIEFDDIYIFVFLNEDEYYDNGKVVLSGEVSYQLDPNCAYGGELIDVNSIDVFFEKLASLDAKKLEGEYGNYAEADIRPGAYVEYEGGE